MKLSFNQLFTALTLVAGAQLAAAEPATSTTANQTETSAAPQFTFKPIGRVQFDGALYSPDGNGFSDGFALPDTRLGVRADYGKWSGTVVAGYSFGKLTMKDVYIQYNIKPNQLLRMGYFIHHFGIVAASPSSLYPAMLAPISDTFFGCSPRNVGAMYLANFKNVAVSGSVFSDGSTITTAASDQGKSSIGAMSRFIFHPASLKQHNLIAHVGVSLAYQSALHSRAFDDDAQAMRLTPGYFNFSASYPTRVSTASLLSAKVSDAKGVFKLSPELIVAKNRVAFEGQYYYMNVNREAGCASYAAHGAYGMLRSQLIGKGYSYSAVNSVLAAPKPGTLELVLGYNYTNADSKKCAVYGGVTNDYSATFNYYINPYILTRLRYSYTDFSSDNNPTNKRHINTIQARLQINF
jgi:phosphate-selective porin OprO/OprP